MTRARALTAVQAPAGRAAPTLVVAAHRIDHVVVDEEVAARLGSTCAASVPLVTHASSTTDPHLVARPTELVA